MIGIVSVTSDSSAVRIALLSHHWTDFPTARGGQDWAGLASRGYRYAPADRAFMKDCVGPAGPDKPAGAAPPDRELRRVLCQAALDHLAGVAEVGMYTQMVAQLARRGLHWRGRCLTQGEVVSALNAAP